MACVVFRAEAALSAAPLVWPLRIAASYGETLVWRRPAAGRERAGWRRVAQVIPAVLLVLLAVRVALAPRRYVPSHGVPRALAAALEQAAAPPFRIASVVCDRRATPVVVAVDIAGPSAPPPALVDALRALARAHLDEAAVLRIPSRFEITVQ